MSTTVTYKGSALTTVNNQTRILKTAGKYMEDDVTLVDVSGSSINNQDKTVTPIESQQTITADEGYTGLGTVTINAISSTYVGSGITVRDNDDLTVSGATVSVPAGYYSVAASKSVASGSVTGPTSLSGSSATVTTGTNTLTLTKTGITTTPTVSAGYISSATASTATVTLTASVTTKAAATYYATTSDQTISANQYLTGTQTIKALSQTNLSAANIKVGTTISVNNGNANVWSVAGTYTSDATATATDILSGETAYVNGNKITGSLSLTTVYHGSSAPSSSTGSNGDIYIQS